MKFGAFLGHKFKTLIFFPIKLDQFLNVFIFIFRNFLLLYSYEIYPLLKTLLNNEFRKSLLYQAFQLGQQAFFVVLGQKRGRKEQYFLYRSQILSSTIGKNSEAEKSISSQACKEKIQATIHTIGNKLISNKDGEKSFLSSTEPFIEFLDRVIERVYNYIKEVRRKGR